MQARAAPRMAAKLPCIISVGMAHGDAHFARLENLGGAHLRMAALPNHASADVHHVISEGSHKLPNLTMKLVNNATNDMSTEKHHRPFHRLPYVIRSCLWMEAAAGPRWGIPRH